jgi:uncharacterized protein with NRDE domain
MCLIVLAYKVHPSYPLIVAANRDEFLERPTVVAHFWPDAAHILAGRDLRAGGTWLGVTTGGRFAALTNHRDLRRPPVSGPSRGDLVRKALETGIEGVDTSVYEGFNLLHGTVDELMYHSNVNGAHSILEPGIHGLSNHLLNTPWPKVQRARQQLTDLLGSGAIDPEDLFQLLGDITPATDDELPDTGIGLEWERVLSPIHIRTERYGTRCSTVLLVDHQSVVTFEEKSYAPRNHVRENIRPSSLK